MCRPKEQHASRPLADDLAGGGVTYYHAYQSDWGRQGIVYWETVYFFFFKFKVYKINSTLRSRGSASSRHDDVTMNDVHVYVYSSI